MFQSSKTIKEYLTAATQELQAVTDERESQLEAELLLAFSLQKSRTWLKTWPEFQLTNDDDQLFCQLIERRLTGEPLAYIIGSQDFWTFSLKVTQDTLVPRPETELLVELALEKIPLEGDFNVVDLGTGSGAIACALASERSQATIFALDFSEKALAVALQNVDDLSLANVQCLQNSWLDNWQKGQLDLIVSNPPYVAAGDPHLKDLSFEPYSALVAQDNGYADIRTIAEQAKAILSSNGYLMFEHGFEQAQTIQSILLELGYREIETFQDLAGLDRVTIAKLIN